MRRKALSCLAAVFVAASAASCVMVMDPEHAPDSATSAEFVRTFDFQAGGTLTLEQSLGNVRITGWDQESVEVVAEPSALRQEGKPRLQATTLWDLEPSVDIKKSGDGIRVRTRSLGGPWSSGGVDYAIRVPHSVNLNGIKVERGDVEISDVYGRLDADVASGRLTVVNFSGPLRAAIGTGAADVELLDVRDTDTVEITVGEGDLTLRLQPEANVEVEAETPVGEISSPLPWGSKLPARTLSGRLGSGGARIVLKALQGNIRILETH
jgi:hypothetical protein